VSGRRVSILDRVASRRSIPDPRLARIDPSGARLPAIGAERLTPQFLRERFHHPPVWTPEFIDDRMRLGADLPRAAAVLVPVVMHAAGPTVLLTERTAHLSAHAGQVAFPGGRTEPADASPVATALRETEEEIGLPRALIEILGSMPLYQTGSGFAVTPVVGLVSPAHVLCLDANEVAETFEVPLSFLMDPVNHQRRLYRWTDGAERSFFAIPWTGDDGREHFIWGVTAAMLRNFYRFVAA
jgi:8-oxo-dGTP pyrophosphatase MutT (NUDIX family)